MNSVSYNGPEGMRQLCLKPSCFGSVLAHAVRFCSVGSRWYCSTNGSILTSVRFLLLLLFSNFFFLRKKSLQAFFLLVGVQRFL